MYATNSLAYEKPPPRFREGASPLGVASQRQDHILDSRCRQSVSSWPSSSRVWPTVRCAMA